MSFLLPLSGQSDLVIESGCGCYVFDSRGRRYLDAITGIGVNALGYGHPRIVAALVEQAPRLIHTSNLFQNAYQERLAEKLCGLTGMDRAFFSSSGAEAMECALKAVRAFNPRKTRLVALRNSFHGRTCGALAVMGQAKYRRPFEPLMPAADFVEPNDCAALARAVTEDTAGIVVEPIQGEGGIIPLEDEFLSLARDLATRSGALLVVDEVQCGLGRTGKMFGYEWSGIRPDIVVLAKPLAAGLPIGATLLTEAAARALPPGTHGTTFGGGPLVCRVALEVLSVLEEILPNVSRMGGQLFRGLSGLRHIKEVRGKGLMLGLELMGRGAPIVERARGLGLLVNCTQETVLRLLPPFILSPQEAQEIVRILGEALEYPHE